MMANVEHLSTGPLPDGRQTSSLPLSSVNLPTCLAMNDTIPRHAYTHTHTCGEFD